MKKFFIIGFFSSIFVWTLISAYRIASTTAPDFSVLWLVAKDFGHTANPYLNPNIYTPSGYPPFTYLFYIPLTLLSFNIAQGIFVLFSIFSILASVWISIKLIFKKVNLTVFLFASSLTLLSFPTKFTLGMGQINGVVLLLLLLSFYLETKHKPVPAGILYGISIMLKPVFAFFLLYFILKKRWRLIYYSVLTVILGFTVTYVFYGLGIWKYWITEIIVPLLNYAGREVYYNQGFVGFVSRITPDIFVRQISEWLILAAISFLILKFRKIKNSLWLLSFFVTSLVLTDSLSWQHHFIWLIFPFTFLTKAGLKNKKIWFWILLGISYLLVTWNFKNPSIFPAILLSNTFYGAFILFLLHFYNHR